MSETLLPEDDGATPLTGDEREGLKLSYVTTRADLSAVEQDNILDAEAWAFRRKRNNVLSRDYLNDLHKHMFSRVWKWAGRYRKTGKNVGVAAYRIATDLQQMIDDCTYWIEHDTYQADEIAVRFHHRLVYIHPYPNGNGWHSRLAADLLLRELQRPRFTWGRVGLTDAGTTRQTYIAALRAADQHDFGLLLEFVRS